MQNFDLFFKKFLGASGSVKIYDELLEEAAEHKTGITIIFSQV